MTAEGAAHGPQIAIWRAGVGLLGLILALSGCAHSPARSLSRMWQDVPKVTWSTVPDATPAPKTAEPNVAANTPSDSAETVAAVPKSRSAGLRNSLRVSRHGDRHSEALAAHRRQSSTTPHDPFLEHDPGGLPNNAVQSSSPSIAEVGELQIVSARDRLRAALSEDAQRVETPEQLAGEQERLRLRIESLMNRARVYLDEGQLVAAKRAAELAQTLTETSHLELALDEERPVDLLTTINGQLEAQQALARTNAEVELPPESDAESDSDLEIALEERTDPNAVQQVAGPSGPDERRSMPFGPALPFDPYGPQSTVQPENPAETLPLGNALVVLESPSFDVEEQEEVSPIGYATESATAAVPTNMDKLKTRFQRSDRRPELAIRPDRNEHRPAGESTLPPLPMEFASPTADSNSEPATAPATSTGDSSGPTLDPAPVSDPPFEQESESEADMLDDEADAATAANPPKPAIIWPRWLTLALASLLVTGFCGWLWRRQSLAAR